MAASRAGSGWSATTSWRASMPGSSPGCFYGSSRDRARGHSLDRRRAHHGPHRRHQCQLDRRSALRPRPRRRRRAHGRRLSRAARLGLAAGARAGRGRDLDGRHRTHGGRPDQRGRRPRPRRAARRGPRVRRTDPAALRRARPRDAREQPEAGPPAAGRGRHPEPARHGAGVPHPASRASPGRPARRAARDEDDDGRDRAALAAHAARRRRVPGTRLPDLRADRVGARRDGAGLVEPAEARVSFRASFPEISLRIVVHGEPASAAARLEALAARIRERIGPYVYGEGPVTLEEVVGRLLRERELTLALAESVTGGLVGHRVTNVPGSSAYLRGAVVAYANRAKRQLLGVRQETLDAHGAGSGQTAAGMTGGARSVFGTDLGRATTGIAGPEAATADKPAGTLWLALAAADGTVVRRYQLWGTRDWMKLLASQIALDWLRRHALGQPVIDSQLFRPRS